MYKNFIKRILDIICTLFAMIVFCWLFVIVALLVRFMLGRPVIFKQPRPGKKDKNGREKIFCLYKFRTMTEERKSDGTFLSDKERLTPFGEKLRNWSLDELPEAWNILKGDMSIVGPRPQLVRDMVFMTKEQRHRHDVRPGLTGLAQVSGRNAISWDDKLALDLQYLQHMNFLGDVKIVLLTLKKVFVHEGITADGQATADDYGDALFKEGRIMQEQYESKLYEAEQILREADFS